MFVKRGRRKFSSVQLTGWKDHIQQRQYEMAEKAPPAPTKERRAAELAAIEEFVQRKRAR